MILLTCFPDSRPSKKLEPLQSHLKAKLPKGGTFSSPPLAPSLEQQEMRQKMEELNIDDFSLDGDDRYVKERTAGLRFFFCFCCDLVWR